MPLGIARMGRACLALLGLALGGCTIGTPYRSTGVAAPDEVVVAITQASVDPAQRRLFDTQLDRVVGLLPKQPGLVGWSLRKELFGTEAWTLTAWTDEAARAAFVADPVHAAAIRASAPAVTGTRFARVRVAAKEMPLGWERALAILAAEGRSY